MLNSLKLRYLKKAVKLPANAYGGNSYGSVVKTFGFITGWKWYEHLIPLRFLKHQVTFITQNNAIIESENSLARDCGGEPLGELLERTTTSKCAVVFTVIDNYDLTFTGSAPKTRYTTVVSFLFRSYKDAVKFKLSARIDDTTV